MAGTTRSNLITDPALVLFNTTCKFYTKEPIEVRIEPKTFMVGTDAHGDIEPREDSHQVVVRALPDGQWIASLIPELWPYANTNIGASIYGGTDVALEIHGRSGAKHSIINAAITKMPNIILSANKTMLGPIEFTGLRKLSSAWSEASSLYTIATGSTFVDSAFAPANIKTQTWTGAWGGTAVTGFDAIKTQDGWTIEFDMRTQDIETDDEGIIDKRLVSVGVMARCVPIDPDVTAKTEIQDAQLYQGSGAARGKVAGKTAVGNNNLVITGLDTTSIITINNARLVRAGYRFGATQIREGEIGFVAARTFTSGAQDALWTLAPVT